MKTSAAAAVLAALLGLPALAAARGDNLKKADEAYKKRDYGTALKFYNAAINVDKNGEDAVLCRRADCAYRTGDLDGTWSDFTTLTILGFPVPVNDACMTADGRYLLTANADGTVFVLRLSAR